MGRPKMFYGQRIHDKCYRRAFFDAGQFVEAWDDDGARKGWCLYKMGCRGPVTTYNSCSTFEVEQRRFLSHRLRPRLHRLLAKLNFWDNGPFYQRLSGVVVPGIDATPNAIGEVLGAAAVIGVGSHLVSTVVRQNARKIHVDDTPPADSKSE
jgi:hydrogenase small subunit